MKKTNERAATEAEVDTGKISLFGAFSQSSQRVRTLQALLADARRDDWRKCTQWTTTTTTTTTTIRMTAELSKAAAAAATEGEGSARRGSSICRNT